jgi:hypothetical protein
MLAAAAFLRGVSGLKGRLRAELPAPPALQ